MTANEFRKIALSFPETIESAHMDHPDFRVGGKIFATLGAPDKAWGMVKLWPDEQAAFMKAEPKTFVPAAGAWGRGGATLVRLRAAKKATIVRAMAAAWHRTAPKQLAKKFPLEPPA
jgi:hypothetical protein